MGNTQSGPPDFFEYLGAEYTNLHVTLAKMQAEFNAFTHVDQLYKEATDGGSVAEQDDIPLMSLFLFVHYHLYNSTATLLRCHMAEAQNSMRPAIDAALTAYRIIEDRPSHLEWLNRDKSFLRPKEFFRKARRNDPKAFPLSGMLLDRRDACSQYAAHADVDVFAHRLDLPTPESLQLKIQYFQHPANRWEFGWFFLMQLHTFVLILSVFEKYFVGEKGFVSNEWTGRVGNLGKQIEAMMEEAENRADSSAEPRQSS